MSDKKRKNKQPNLPYIVECPICEDEWQQAIMPEDPEFCNHCNIAGVLRDNPEYQNDQNRNS